MRLIGLNDDAHKYWKQMELIDRAHRKAGHQIRDLLLKQVSNIDLSELQRQGKMEFKLSDDDEGGLTAFRVEHILPGTVPVSFSHIGFPFRVEQ